MPAHATVLLRARTLLTALVGLTVVAALAACTTSEQPQDDPTTRAATSPSPTPTPTPTADAASIAPEPPAALAGPGTKENAIAVAEFFQQLVPYVFATGDLAQWSALAHPDCSFCRSISDESHGLTASGQRTRGGAVLVRDPSVVEIDKGRFFQVDMDMDVAPSDLLDATGAVVSSTESSSGHVGVDVVWENGGWSVRAVTATQATS